MGKKIIFFDIDGTLVVCEGKEYVPDSAIEAIKAARRNGHLVYLCTGRSKAEIYPHILDIGIDGVIGAGGGYVEIEDEILYHKTVSDDSLKHLINYFEENSYDYYLESNKGLIASKNMISRVEFIIYGDYINDPEAKKRWDKQDSHFINALHKSNNMYLDDVNKVCFLENKNIPFENLKKEFENEFSIIKCTVQAFGDESGELTVPGIHKATAIEVLIEHLGIEQKDTYAFGDGMNDAEMLEYVKVGIAMGNAKDGLKVIADEVCESQIDDGIYKAMKRHGLI
ncbi:Cof-type HAD-IIB family hydrolase [Clostridium vincentii]|uniref:Putative phosphatase YwpJ n=1 Tax=Clostridium vincentii TaxID=52704 RepID=A0A2T0BIT0_9CLOT|nr:Cof-type HAD-IIB family hydrolase [Clostridium vincentii]PRR83784.1 putative phosphatase YwpJ [Clostridium vincentii]